MKKAATRAVGLIILSLIPLGCINTAQKLNKLELGMTQQQVIQQLGTPITSCASELYSEPVVMWNYALRRGGRARQHYWLTFKQGRLAQWGQINDFGSMPDKTKKIIIEKSTDSPKFQLD